MNFSNPAPIKGTLPKKDNGFKVAMEKLWAGISMISLMVPGPATRDGLAAKNIGVIFFILVVGWLSGCGLYLNMKWISQMHIPSNWFYGFGFVVLLFAILQCFDWAKRVREFAAEKKIIHVNKKSLLEARLGKYYTAVDMLAGICSLLWILAGAIFYERYLCIGFVVISIALISGEHAIKTTTAAKKLFIADSVFTIGTIAVILAKHYLI
jgi:hypothetical protein